MAHDYGAQRAETYAVYAEIQSQAEALPDEADIDYAFVPGANADWENAQSALSDAGFECAQAEDDNGAPYLNARLPDQPMTAMSIWLGEEMATRIALPHGFTPDGWGFLG